MICMLIWIFNMYNKNIIENMLKKNHVKLHKQVNYLK